MLTPAKSRAPMPQIVVDVTIGAEVIAAPASKEQTTNVFCRMMQSWAASLSNCQGSVHGRKGGFREDPS
jgi:hypothetical protein